MEEIQLFVEQEYEYIGCTFTAIHKAKFLNNRPIKLKEFIEWFSREKKKRKNKKIRLNLHYVYNGTFGWIFNDGKYYINRRFWEEKFGQETIELLSIEESWGAYNYVIKFIDLHYESNIA